MTLGPLVAVRLSLVLVAALTLQVSLAPQLQVLGVQGDLMLVLAIAAGLAAGPERGAVLGFVTGIAYDLLLQTPFALSALTYGIVAYLAGLLQEGILRAAWWIPVLTATAASALGVILYGVFGTVVGEDLVSWSLVRITAVVAALNAVLALPALRVMRWVTRPGVDSRARPVYR